MAECGPGGRVCAGLQHEGHCCEEDGVPVSVQLRGLQRGPHPAGHQHAAEGLVRRARCIWDGVWLPLWLSQLQAHPVCVVCPAPPTPPSSPSPWLFVILLQPRRGPDDPWPGAALPVLPSTGHRSGVLNHAAEGTLRLPPWGGLCVCLGGRGGGSPCAGRPATGQSRQGSFVPLRSCPSRCVIPPTTPQPPPQPQPQPQPQPHTHTPHHHLGHPPPLLSVPCRSPSPTPARTCGRLVCLVC